MKGENVSISKIKYNTRDGDGKDIIKEVEIKEYPTVSKDFICAVCGEKHVRGTRTKDIVSGSFTDWNLLRGDMVCKRCTDLFSLYFYSYIVDGAGIHLLNVRELPEALQSQQEPPFLFCVTTSRKKHLFYRAAWNYSKGRFAVNLETETIYTSPERMRELFAIVECLQTLGASKMRLADGELQYSVAGKLGTKTAKITLDFLRTELERSREIQIPLYCGQKRELSEGEAICCINSTLTAWNTRKRHF